MTRNLFYTLLLLPAILLTACDSEVYYDETEAINELGWNLSDTAQFDIPITDSLQVYNIFVDLRISNSYPYSNSFLFVTTTFPDGSCAADTLECPLASPDGQWLGKSSARYIDNRYYLKRQVVFPYTGTYHIDITHGMRDTVIRGIKDIGIRLEKVDAPAFNKSSQQTDSQVGTDIAEPADKPANQQVEERLPAEQQSNVFDKPRADMPTCLSEDKERENQPACRRTGQREVMNRPAGGHEPTSGRS
ncbi:MAG: gliding motility lipoprotein GldH [Bacteroidales bacterium]|nr:gliding motility lipoprotein GldH [Candidatus Colimorpha onthohippi]